MALNKPSLIIIALCVSIHMLGAITDNVYFHMLPHLPSVFLLVSQGSAYLLYPLLGWLADVHFTRYKFVRTVFVLTILGCSVLLLIALAHLLTHGKYFELYAVGGIFLVTYLFALGMFEATDVQFGMDQMLEDSSNQLSTFIQWYYLGSKLGRFVLAILSTGFLLYFSYCQLAVKLCQLTLHIPRTLPVGLLQKAPRY